MLDRGLQGITRDEFTRAVDRHNIRHRDPLAVAARWNELREVYPWFSVLIDNMVGMAAGDPEAYHRAEGMVTTASRRRGAAHDGHATNAET